MAKKKQEVTTDKPVQNDKYMVVKKFKADINGNKIVANPGDMVVLTDFEYKILKRFLE